MSVTNFSTQTVEDIKFMESILPASYKVTEPKRLGSLHCKSSIGIRKPPYINSAGNVVSDDEDDKAWVAIFEKMRYHFADRFLEVFHNVCFCHTDFTVYLKKNH